MVSCSILSHSPPFFYSFCSFSHFISAYPFHYFLYLSILLLFIIILFKFHPTTSIHCPLPYSSFRSMKSTQWWYVFPNLISNYFVFYELLPFSIFYFTHTIPFFVISFFFYFSLKCLSNLIFSFRSVLFMFCFIFCIASHLFRRLSFNLWISVEWKFLPPFLPCYFFSLHSIRRSISSIQSSTSFSFFFSSHSLSLTFILLSLLWSLLLPAFRFFFPPNRSSLILLLLGKLYFSSPRFPPSLRLHLSFTPH